MDPFYIGPGVVQAGTYLPPTAPGAPGAVPAERHPVSLLHEEVMSRWGAGRVDLPPYIADWTRTTPEIKKALREMMCSPVVKPALLGKVFGVASLDLQIHPADDTDYDRQVADFHSYAFERAEGGPMQVAMGVLTGGLIDGYSVLHAPMRVIDRGKHKGRWAYRAFRDKDTEWLTPVADEYRIVKGIIAWENGRQVTYPVNTEDSNLIHTPFLPLWGNPAGVSDLRAAYGPWYKMKLAEQFRAIHLEKFLSPMLVGTYPEGDLVMKDSVESAMERAKSRTWTSVPAGTVIEALQMATRGEAEFASAIKDYTDQIVLAITGATLQMLVANAGGDLRGDSKTQLSQAELFVWYLLRLVVNVYNTRLIPLQTDVNFAGADYPTASLGAVNDADMEPSLRIDQGLAQIGFKHSKAALSKRYSRTAATGPDDELAPPAPPGGAPGLPFAEDEKTAPEVAVEPFR